MKPLIFVVTVFLPALIVGISNITVFPDSWIPATIMLIVTVAASGIFTWKSGDATPKISRYCILADIGICAILCFNLGGHWILAREVSAARQSVEERHTEEDREEKRRADEADRELKLKRADLDLQRAESRRLGMLPPEERRSRLSAPKLEKKPLETPTAAIGKSLERLTPEQVRLSWWWFLTALAIAECSASVLAGAILSGIWEWDRNHDGINDAVQAPNVLAKIVEPSEFPEVLPTGKLEEPAPKARRH